MFTAVRDQCSAVSRQMLPLLGYLKGKTASHLKEIPVAHGMQKSAYVTPSD